MNEELLIGVNNDLPWKLQDDLEHFKNYSLNKPIIMRERHLNQSDHCQIEKILLFLRQ